MTATLLLASTNWWPPSARLARAFCVLGARVAAVCPAGSPLRAVSGIAAVHSYNPLRPLHALRVAIEATDPALIVPGDDRVVRHLHLLHARMPDNDPLRDLIERSLGAPGGFPATTNRGGLIALAMDEGIRVPTTHALSSLREMRAWFEMRTVPVLLKANGWGGSQVLPARSLAEAQRAYRRLSRPLATWRLLKSVAVNHDRFPLLTWLQRERPCVIGQDFICGQLANSMAACWQGRVLAIVAVEVLCVQKTFGPATIVRLIENSEMHEATTRLVRRLGISGFCGFDFILEKGSGRAYLIEMNPRATQLGHLRLGSGRDLAAALYAQVSGTDPPASAAAIEHDTIAFFPAGWQYSRASPDLASAYHDVPWDDPGLLQELRRPPWENRGLLARLLETCLYQFGTGPAPMAMLDALPLGRCSRDGANSIAGAPECSMADHDRF